MLNTGTKKQGKIQVASIEATTFALCKISAKAATGMHNTAAEFAELNPSEALDIISQSFFESRFSESLAGFQYPANLETLLLFFFFLFQIFERTKLRTKIELDGERAAKCGAVRERERERGNFIILSWRKLIDVSFTRTQGVIERDLRLLVQLFLFFILESTFKKQ